MAFDQCCFVAFGPHHFFVFLLGCCMFLMLRSGTVTAVSFRGTVEKQRPAHFGEPGQDTGELPVDDSIDDRGVPVCDEDVPGMEVRMAQDGSAVPLQGRKLGQHGHDFHGGVEGFEMFIGGAIVRTTAGMGGFEVFDLPDALSDEIAPQVEECMPWSIVGSGHFYF